MTVQELEMQIQDLHSLIADLQRQALSLENAKTELLSSQFEHTLHFSGNEHVWDNLEFSEEAVVEITMDEDHCVDATIFTNSKEDLAVFTAWLTSL